MDQINRLEQNAKAIRRRIAYLFFCKYFLYAGIVCAFLAGTVLVVFNVCGKNGALPAMIACTAAVLISLAVSLFMSLRRLVPLEKIIILLDRVNCKGGILLDAGAAINSGWGESLDIRILPKIRLEAGRLIVLFSAALVFVLAAQLMPPVYKPQSLPVKMEITKETESLEKQLKILDTERIITPEEARTLESQIRKIEKSATGEDPVKTWEALDHMRESLKDKAGDFAAETVRRAEAIALSEKAIEAMLKARDNVSVKDFTAASKAMSEVMKKLLEKCPQLSESLSRELKDALGTGSISTHDMELLLKAQQITREQMEQLLEKLKKNGLCESNGNKAQGCKTLSPMTEMEFRELMKMLDQGSSEKCGNQEMACIFAASSSSAPGRGGISRGRGDAPMTWWDKGLDRDDAGFKEIVLPVKAVSSLDKSKLLGVAYGAAQAAPDAKVSTGHLTGTTVDGTQSNRFILLPRHRTAVKKYFTKDK